MTSPPKLCECGCGTPTTIATEDNRRYGWVKGQAKRFIHGHNSRTSPVDYVVDAAGCWIWQRSILPRWGYGMAWRDGRHVLAHRWFYEQVHGPVPTGYQLDHLCRNRACVNPAHLEVVTRRTNARRGANTILTAEQVAEIRAHRPDAARYGRAALAAKYSVSEATIKDIRTGRTWQDASIPT